MRPHPVHVGYLVVGLVFLGLAGFWGLYQLEVVDLAAMAWLVPVLLVVAGTAGLLAAVVRRR